MGVTEILRFALNDIQDCLYSLIHFFTRFDILNLQLHLATLVRILLDGITDVERTLGLDVTGL